jgi:hypothetical protein
MSLPTAHALKALQPASKRVNLITHKGETRLLSSEKSPHGMFGCMNCRYIKKGFIHSSACTIKLHNSPQRLKSALSCARS